MAQRRLIFIFSLFFIALFAHAATPLEELASYTEFKGVDPQKMGRGILSQRGRLFNLQDGLMTETCYLVRIPPERVAYNMANWNPKDHSELGVFIDINFKNPVTPADFTTLRLDGNKGPIEKLYKASFAAGPEKADLNLSHSESQLLAKARDSAPKDKAGVANALANAWKEILFNRTQVFQKAGMAKLAPYEVNGKTINPGQYFTTLLAEVPVITRQFAELLREVPLQGNTSPASAPTYYWGLFDADGDGTLHTGAVFTKKIGDKIQMADVEFYVSNSYYLSLTLYNIWPVTINGQPASLVWRGDFYAAPTLSFTHGIERMAYAAVMIQEIKKAIRCFQDDAEKQK